MVGSPEIIQKRASGTSTVTSFSHDGSNGMPYVAHLPNGTDRYLVIPIREWDEK
jgi:hypothetical protein